MYGNELVNLKIKKFYYGMYGICKIEMVRNNI